MMNQNRKTGFTLVEIMVVVVIIGLLAAAAIPAFQLVRNRSIAKVALNNCRQLSQASNQYFLEHGTTQVTSSELIGPLQYVKKFPPAANESYSATISTDGICTAGPLPNGGSVTYVEQ